jgi:hypothetical protein
MEGLFPPLVAKLSTRLINPGFIRAMTAYADGMGPLNPNPSKEQREAAGWAQAYFRMLGLDPCPEFPTQQDMNGLVEIWRLRERVMRDAESFPGFQKIDPTWQRKFTKDTIMKELTEGKAAPGTAFLQRAFGPRDANGVRARMKLSATLESMSGPGKSPLENCMTLQDAADVIWGEMQRVDNERTEIGQEPVYDQVTTLLPVEVASPNEYDSIAGLLEKGQASAIYEQPTDPLPVAEQYATLPREPVMDAATGI